MSGGSTIFLYHPGATISQTDLTLAILTAKVYIDPKILHDYPVTQAFRVWHISHGWRQVGMDTQAPASTHSGDPHLVPLPIDVPSAGFFTSIGRHSGSLEQILSFHTVHSHLFDASPIGRALHGH